MSWLVTAPLLVPLAGALLAYFVPRPWIGVAAAAALLATGALLLGAVLRYGVLVAQIGGWPAPFGISLVADHLSAFMVVLAGLLGVSVTAYALVDIDRQHRQLGFDPLLQILLGGTCAAFLTGDLFNLYVWFEVMLIASFALLALAGGRRTLDGAVKFVTLNLLATMLLLPRSACSTAQPAASTWRTCTSGCRRTASRPCSPPSRSRFWWRSG